MVKVGRVLRYVLEKCDCRELTLGGNMDVKGNFIPVTAQNEKRKARKKVSIFIENI